MRKQAAGPKRQLGDVVGAFKPLMAHGGCADLEINGIQRRGVI